MEKWVKLTDKKSVSGNEVVALMHESNADSLRKIADHAEKFNYSAQDLIALMRESADEMEAQIAVVKLRDDLLNNTL